MINFIIVDDIEKYVSKVVEMIDSLMMGSCYEYKIHKFNDYDLKFMKVMEEPLANKIYIMDIETKTSSGIDVARKIRNSDLNSVILFMTAYEDLGNLVAKKILLTLALISKFDDFDNNMNKALKEAIDILGKRRIIKIQDYSTVYLVPIDDILYVTRDSFERKAVIVTSYDEYKVSKSLTEIKELAGDLLTKTHRACLVNEKRVRKIDKKNNIIYFDNGTSIDLISPNYKKELV